MRVTEALNHGWQLHGSLTLTFNGESCIAGQALVKEVKSEEFSPSIDPHSY